MLFDTLLLAKLCAGYSGGGVSVAGAMCRAVEKVRRRCPHVFGLETATTRAEAEACWQRSKAEEKTRQSIPVLVHEDDADLTEGSPVPALDIGDSAPADQEEVTTAVAKQQMTAEADATVVVVDATAAEELKVWSVLRLICNISLMTRR